MLEELQLIFNYPLICMGELQITLWTIFYFVCVLILAYFVSRYSRFFLRDRILARSKLDEGMQYMIAKIVGYVVFTLGFFIGLETLGIDLSSFTVLAGAFGLGIGFGLQNIINNFVSGLIILSERSIQINDRLEVGGLNGQLKKIGARSSLLVTGENVLVIVPNAEFITNKVINWGHGLVHHIRFDVDVSVSYDSDLNLVEKILLEVAEKNPHVLEDPLPVVELVRFGQSSIDFKLYVWTIDMVAKGGTLKSQLYFTIWDLFRKHNIEIPFLTQTIRVPYPIQVSMQPEK